MDNTIFIFIMVYYIHTDSTPHSIFRIPNRFTNSYYSNPNRHASKAVQHFQNGKDNGVGNGRNRYTILTLDLSKSNVTATIYGASTLVFRMYITSNNLIYLKYVVV